MSELLDLYIDGQTYGSIFYKIIEERTPDP